MKLRIIQNRKYYYAFSGLLFLASIFSLIAWGLKPGLDFTGGSLLDVSFNASRPHNTEVQQVLAPLNLGDIMIQPAGDKDIIIRFKTVDEPKHQQILSTLNDKFKTAGATSTKAVTEQRFESVGPVIGQELENKAWMAIILASLCIIIYIAIAFRRASKPVVSWKYGLAAIIALIHDITIVAGLFSILGHFAGVEVDSLFITALLTVMGFSVHDTIVVFDRTRENLFKHYSGSFEDVVNDSVNQTMTRSINTSLTVLLVLFSLYALGGDTVKNFILALLFGIAIGTYSSVFVASPIIVDWNLFDRKLKNK